MDTPPPARNHRHATLSLPLMIVVCAILSPQHASSQEAPRWIEQGPGPAPGDGGLVSGAIQAIAADPIDKDRVFVATVNGGIWRTENATDDALSSPTCGGPCWTPLTDHEASLSMRGLVFDPLDSSRNTLYGVLGGTTHAHPISGSGANPLNGFLKTTDGGSTWSLMSLLGFENALDPPKVIGISSGSDADAIADLRAIATATDAFAPAEGVDCDGDGAVDIPEGEPLVCQIAAAGDGIGDAIIAIVEAATVVDVSIEIKAGLGDAPINLRGATIPVAIPSAEAFDARDVVPSSVCFGVSPPDPDRSDCTESHGKGHLEDVTGDGRADLVLHFDTVDTVDTGISIGDVEACLVAETIDGVSVRGCDAIRVVTRD